MASLNNPRNNDLQLVTVPQAPGGLMVSVLDIGPKVRGFKRCRGRFIFKGDTSSTTSFGGEVKPSVACRSTLLHVEESYSYEKSYFVSKIHGNFSPIFICLGTRRLLTIARELWWMNQALLELRWRCIIDQKWSQCMGRLVRCHPVTVTVLLLRNVDLLCSELFLRRGRSTS
jgi:hypothetical protein